MPAVIENFLAQVLLKIHLVI